METVQVKNAIFIPIFLSISTFTIPNKLLAANLISLKTEYFRSANSNFREIYGSGAIFGIGGRSERGSGLIWGLELEYFSREGKPLDYPAKKSKKGLLVEGPDLSVKTGVDWDMDRTSTSLTIVSFLSTVTYKLLRGSPVSPNLSLKTGFSSAKEKFSGEYEYDGSAGLVEFKDDKSAFGLLVGGTGGIELFRGPFRIVLFCGYNYVPSWSNLGYQDLGGFTAGAQILFTFHFQ
jgi:hypothetical protein